MYASVKTRRRFYFRLPYQASLYPKPNPLGLGTPKETGFMGTPDKAYQYKRYQDQLQNIEVCK